MNKAVELSLKEIQEESFKALKVFKEICEKNDFKYWLCYGTLIGTIRHDGFIPWDDDIDVQMPREDYEKFIDYCLLNKQSLLPFELHHFRTNKKYIYPIARFSNSNFCIDYFNTKDYGLGTFIDIYPVDEVDINSKKLISCRTKYMNIISFLGMKKYSSNTKGLKGFAKRCTYVCCKILRPYKVLAKYDSFFKKHKFGIGYASCYNWETRIYNMKNNLFNEIIKHKFNGEDFNIPKEYDVILKTIYGDYMKLPPESERTPHHNYSVYRK